MRTWALIAVPLTFAVAIGAGWWLENRGWHNPVTGQRSCHVLSPRSVQALFNVHASRSRANLNRMTEWLTREPAAVRYQYGPACQTPLHLIARSGWREAASLLIARGADVGARDGYRDTPLHTAANYAQVEIVTLLLGHGADVRAVGQDGKTPLHAAVFGAAGTTDVDARLQVARALITAGADVNAREPNSGFTPLRYAIGPSSSADPRMVELLLTQGAGVGATDAQGGPALIRAAAAGDRATVERLLDAGADVNGADRDGTALSAAAHSGHLAVATLLVQRGADVDRRVRGSRLPWQGLPLAVALVGPRADEQTIARRRDVAAMLVAAGSDVDARDAGGETLLARVAAAGDRRAVELLGAHGADIQARDATGRTPLHEASRSGRLEVAAWLLSAGADPKAKDHSGRTPIDVAAGDPEMEALLVRYIRE